MLNTTQEECQTNNLNADLSKKMHNDICSLRNLKDESTEKFRELSDAEVQEKISQINQEYENLEQIEEVESYKILESQEDLNYKVNEGKSSEINNDERKAEDNSEEQDLRQNTNPDSENVESGGDEKEKDVKIEKKIVYNKYDYYVSKDDTHLTSEIQLNTNDLKILDSDKDIKEAKYFTLDENSKNKIAKRKSNKNLTPNKITLEIAARHISQFEAINQDHDLKPFEGRIKQKLDRMNHFLREIEKNENSLLDFSQSYKKMGLNIIGDEMIFREYAPGASTMSLFGEFNNWQRDEEEFKCIRDDFGFWTLNLPKDSSSGEFPIKHNTKFKLYLTLADGKQEDRNPVWSTYLIQNPENHLYDAVFWHPSQEDSYTFKHKCPQMPRSLRIYEAHVGMSSIEPKVSTYRAFADEILPRIKACGYTAVQLMAIQEHVYYGSFGYHVTNLFAISSRSGTPDDLKYLIDTAHGMGLMVFIDLIHSHASSNVLDGFNYFDGTDYLYFHAGGRGFHSLWESRLYNYSNWETLRLLLSNLRFYLEEYKFDGFRFDGITSMLYHHHGINYSFGSGYWEYFGDNLDIESCVYLMLANKLVREVKPDCVTIAEDVSGMPCLCLPIEQGGFGFDYRLNMSIPDKWIQILKEIKDENWNMGNIVYTLTNRRHNEKHISYVESHDQSIVGDKTLSMWLFNQEIYENMSIDKQSIVIDRGMALHKMIRLLTYALGGEAYLNFIGNEFGHPEWVDFPRAGNNYSHHYCRRRWDLCDDAKLRFQFLHNFDREMHSFETKFPWLESKHQFISLVHESDKLIVFEKSDLLFVFNFNVSECFDFYRIGTKWASDHVIVFNSDEKEFGGFERLHRDLGTKHTPIKEKWNNRSHYVHLNIPNRCCMVLIAEENLRKYK